MPRARKKTKPNWWETDGCREHTKPLDARLQEIGARIVSEWEGVEQYDGRPSCLWQLYSTGLRQYLVQIHNDGHGWQVWSVVSPDSNRIDSTLAEIV